MGPYLKTFVLALLAMLAMPASAQKSVLYDTSTYYLILPTNILGMKFGGTVYTNLAGTGLTVSSGNLQVNTSVIATDAEVAAGYQPLDATLTAVAGASTGANTLVYFSAADTAAVTTFTAWGRGLVDDVDQTAARITLGLVPGTDVQAYDSDLAAVAGLSSNGLLARTGTGSFAIRTITGDSEITVTNGDGVSGNPTLALAASITRDSELYAYVQGEIASLGSGSDQWSEWDTWEVRRWEFGGNSSGLGLEPGLAFTAIASGTGGTTTGQAVFDGQNAFYIRSASGTATSTGGYVNDGVNTLYLSAQPRQWKEDFSLNRTNGAVYRFGYSDSTSTAEPVDALQLVVTNDLVCGVSLSNSVKFVTASTFQLQQGVSYRGRINQTNDYAHFLVYSNVVGSSAVLVYEDTIATGIPLGSSRLLGISSGGFNTATANTNGVDLLYLNRQIERKYR